jgi:hypothetical protein
MQRGVWSPYSGRILALCALCLPLSTLAAESPRVLRAKRIFERLAGVPASTIVVPPLAQSQEAQLRALALQGPQLDVDAVANLAMQDRHFLELTVLRLATPWSNTDGSASASLHLNDVSALAIGMVRDNVPFNEFLFGDHFYRGHENITNTLYPYPPGTTVDAAKVTRFTRGGAQWEHFRDLQQKGFDLSLPSVLKKVSQREAVFYTPPNCMGETLNPNDNAYDCNFPNGPGTVGTPWVSAQGSANPDIAGALTTWSFSRAGYENGTNRRAVNLLVRNHLCDDHVRRDVDRSPGGDHTNYQSNCVGCHAPMDALAGAFSLFDFEASHLVYRPGLELYGNNPAPLETSIRPKNNKNESVFPAGHVVSDTSWVNHLWRSESASLGWRNPAGGSYKSGVGVNALGRAIAASRRFSECKVEQVYQLMCHGVAGDIPVSTLIEIADVFEAGNYNLKTVFREVMKRCF